MYVTVKMEQWIEDPDEEGKMMLDPDAPVDEHDKVFLAKVGE
jgi:hypothetical protein